MIMDMDRFKKELVNEIIEKCSPIIERAACDFVNEQERIDLIRQETKDYMRTIEINRKGGKAWWSNPYKRMNGDIVIPVDEIEDDLYNFYFLSECFYTNEFEKGVARIAIGELQFDLSQEYSKEFMILKKIVKLIMTVDDEYQKYDDDLNGMHYQELYERYRDILDADEVAMRKRINDRMYVRNKNYKIIKIESFEHSNMFDVYSDFRSPMCFCRDEYKYDAYIHGGDNAMYMCLYSGIDNVERPDIENGCETVKASWVNYKNMHVEGYIGLPWDEYGMSLIVVIVNPDGSLNTCASRWNHALKGFARDFLDEEQISGVLGVNFYETFLPEPEESNEEVELY